MNDPRARQARFNAESRGQWAGFADHRAHVSGLLAGGPGRLCVLGAGNGNDLDLPRLLEAHREVHLVDLDSDALSLGAGRQGVAGRPSLSLHGGLDLTGMLDVMARWSPSTEVPRADLAALVEWPAGRVALTLPGPFDVVASTCLLSQLIGNAHHALGPSHPQIGQVARAIRMGHLRLLAGLVRPGGRFLLITDLANSENCPEIVDATGVSRQWLVDNLANNHRLSRGVNPYQILAILRKDPTLSAVLDWPEMTGDWTWRLHDRVYLVCSIEARARTPLSDRLPRASGPFILRSGDASTGTTRRG